MNWNKGGPGTKRGFGFGGFAISAGKKEEPKLPQQSHSAFGATSSSGFGKSAPPQLPSFYKIGSKRANFDEENAYFEDEEEDSSNVDLPYIPAENSPTRQQFHSKPADSDSDDDPLEAFMAEVEDQAARDMKRLEEKDKEKKNVKGIRDDIEEEDDQEAYFRYMAENPTAGVVQEEEEDNLEYDSDGNPIAPSKKIIDPLPPIDHSEIDYPPFEKNFYNEHEEITSLTPQQLIDLRHKLNLRVSGAAPPRPGSSFAHFGFDEQLMHQIRKSEYTQPTPIQCQGVPVALSGRDMIGIAKTGSGKTAAFIWPMLIHIMDQKELEPGDGPIAVIVCPTRELCQQIHAECKRFGKAYNLRSVAVYGGGSMWEQAKALQEGAEIVVCTPGRLIDHVKKKATNLQRVSYLVFDEADRMFDMGFEYQVRSIASHVRPDRQTLLFSATFRKKIEKLARDILIDPIRVVQGDIGEANEDVTQIVEILHSGPSKWNWLTRRLVEFTSSGSVLLFVTKKANAEELANNLKQEGHNLGLLHGDMDQSERNKVISDFKKKDIPVLVATDVAARGLDIPSIKTVINYDVARDIDTHTHRIGRTGRAGEKGVAYTLLTPKDSNFAGDLVRNLEGANQHVSKELLDLAMQNAWFRKSRFKGGKGKKLNIGGGGLGYRERPGLGSENTDRGNNNNVMSNYEAYKPSTGAMGDRLTAMKAAFQSQYKSHFVAASLSNQKAGSSAAGASGWTSAGSLNSVPTNSSQQGHNSPDSPIASATKGIPGFGNTGNLSSAPVTYPTAGAQGVNNTASGNNSREGIGGGNGKRERYTENRGGSRHSHGESGGGGGSRHGDSPRHGDGGRHGEGYRYPESSSRHADGHRHGENRHGGGGGRHGESRGANDGRNGESRKEGCNRESRMDPKVDSSKMDKVDSKTDKTADGFAVPEPPKRKKSRWDS
ncbi:ATP-dependent RNA helicase DDX42 isoform X1 [Rousettus aegyptiacus]|uniref:ATP-dependent RNA helicase DDX42 n=5 Tax=Rousettus aegyptiacus TaxID=9407 RepID=A0A7J8G6N1_ROUAE|nr:ATP-dependent RNA helicase DDX42 isoform X1 [Rousettus aegyptiacus]XP_015984004.1 ATP-dependent RNA helicase DDX42 isoform X1 [Rousettus aegyptiacus]XP_015984014.1 ATP-dependent RNA helicase DDX42 isoform X1 [Rousettus aegyptiacus]KAF6455597.1 DEAD-box helicase 42 [Rousettus aegyptiacus]